MEKPEIYFNSEVGVCWAASGSFLAFGVVMGTCGWVMIGV